jgi:hypothetical protein
VPHIYSIISNSAFPPATVNMMGEIFNRARASIERHYYYDQRADTELELARMAQAKAIIMLARLGTADPAILLRNALRIVHMPSVADADGVASTSMGHAANAES